MQHIESIKVHCVVSSLCEPMRRQSLPIDYRPLYFGVWDAPFVVANDEIVYHTEDVTHESFFAAFTDLFSVQVEQWFNPQQPRAEHVAEYERRLATKRADEHHVIMLDLSLLPERENKSHQKPFPHYVLLEPHTEEEWLMIDADFRWEGVLAIDRIRQSIVDNPFAGAFSFGSESLQQPTAEAVHRYFTASMHDHNPYMLDIRALIQQLHHEGNWAQLVKAVRQLPVLAIRKYAYEHGFAYFKENGATMTDEAFEQLCVDIDTLVKGFTTVQFRVMKGATLKQSSFIDEALRKLAELDELEGHIKRQLRAVHHEWYARQLEVSR